MARVHVTWKLHMIIMSSCSGLWQWKRYHNSADDKQAFLMPGPLQQSFDYVRATISPLVSREVRDVRRVARGCPDRRHHDDGLMAGGSVSMAIRSCRACSGRTTGPSSRLSNRSTERVSTPAFMATFIGALALTGLAALLHLAGDQRPLLAWIAAAFVLFLVVFVITIGVNVPRKNEIKAAGDIDHMTDPHGVRERFDEARWVRWNHLRTFASTVEHSRVQAAAGLAEDARASIARAISLYESKGNVAALRRLRA